jgi:polysaccharide biosynthesis transport protein
LSETTQIAAIPETEGDLNEILDRVRHIISRRRWWILLPACGITFATIAVLSLVPNKYTSEATLLVVQQQVPQRYVTPTATTDMTSALQAMTQEVLSRSRLLGIMGEFGLYTKEKQHLAEEEVVALMRNNIRIQPLELGPPRGDFNAFKISFVSDDPLLAQKVTSRLTSLFIQENLTTRENQSTNTTNFLSAELESAKTRLTEQEHRLRDFKMSNLGELPEQQQGNLAILTGLQTQLQNTMAALGRAQQQRVYLESLVQSDLARLRSERETLLGHFTVKHPRVVKIDQEIVERQALLADSKASKIPGIDTPGHAGAAAAGTEDDTSLASLRSQLEANRLEIENLSKDEKQQKAAVTQYQNRLNLTPVREQQLAGIVRDYELLKQNYADLLSKQQQSQLATSLEKQQEGQQFRLVEPPNLPVLPSSPQRVKISLGGAAGGLCLGLALAFFLSLMDHSLKTEKEVSARFALPLVLGVPSLPTPMEERLHAWKKGFEWLAGSALALAVVVAEFYVYLHG